MTTVIQAPPNTTPTILMSDSSKLLLNGSVERSAAPQDEDEILIMLQQQQQQGGGGNHKTVSASSSSNNSKNNGSITLPPLNVNVNVAALEDALHGHGRNPQDQKNLATGPGGGGVSSADSALRNSPMGMLPASPSSPRSSVSVGGAMVAPGPPPPADRAQARHERILQQDRKDKDFYNSLLKLQDEQQRMGSAVNVNRNGNNNVNLSASINGGHSLNHSNLINNGSAPFPGASPGPSSATAMNPSLSGAASMDPYSSRGSSSLNTSHNSVLSTNPYANHGHNQGIHSQLHHGHVHGHGAANVHAHLHDKAAGPYVHQQHQHQHHPELSLSTAAGLAPGVSGGINGSMNGSSLNVNGGINGNNGTDPRLLQLRENALLNQHQLNDAHHRLIMGAHQLARNKELQQQEQLSLQRLMLQQQQNQHQPNQQQHQHQQAQGEQQNRLSLSENGGLGDIQANTQDQNQIQVPSTEKKRQLSDIMVTGNTINMNNNEQISPENDKTASNKRLRSIKQHPAVRSLDNTTTALANVLSTDLHSSALTGVGAPSNLLYGGHGHGQVHGHGQHILEQTALMEHIHRQRILSHHRRMMIDAEMEELLLRHNDIHNHSISASQLAQSRLALLNPSSTNPASSLDPSPSSSLTSPYGNYSTGLMNHSHASAVLLHEQAMKKREDLINLSIAGLNANSNDDTLELTAPKQHFSVRPYMHLGTETDEIWLSRFLSFLRLECIEVFTATRTDVFERKTSKKIHINQVGLRCRYCAHLPYRARVVRSSCFPSSICRIYQSLTMMIREHFSRCQEMPAKTRERYTELKWMTKKGEIESKTHWIDSAKSLGMVDTEKGIFLNRPMKLTIPKEPCQPVEEQEEKSQSPV